MPGPAVSTQATLLLKLRESAQWEQAQYFSLSFISPHNLFKKASKFIVIILWKQNCSCLPPLIFMKRDFIEI